MAQARVTSFEGHRCTITSFPSYVFSFVRPCRKCRNIFILNSMADELLSLKWNNHKSTFADVLSVLRDQV
ncbi:hypothetical protein Anas_03755 [Armadillidium nasatum]|uniref:Uncharacterized protein n=1 Tax=Armadillidium nasatum TaxID=96803 RepID=A0A5N5SP64_9CRUS|nr:hypothetical protein Anas_03755 [Armadillidium nasatum]